MKKEKAFVNHANGDLAGLWTIDGKKCRDEFGESRFWEGVDEIIRLYQELHPNEYDTAVTENVETRLDNKNKFGSNTSGSTRIALNLPYRLYLTLIDYEPRIFRDKKKRQAFMKRYNALRACDAV